MGEGAGVRRTAVGIAAAVVLAGSGMALTTGAPAASGEALAPWWGVSTGSEPTDLVTGGTGEIVVIAQNRGDASTSGEVTISDDLPAGLEASGIEGIAGADPGSSGERGPVSCVLATLACTFGAVQTENSKGEQVPETLRPYEQIEVRISVSVRAGASTGEENSASVAGGGAVTAASARHAIEVNGSEKFGVEDYELIAENAGGSIDQQAGSHPFALTSVVTLNTTTPGPRGDPRIVASPRDISPALPAGLIADPAALARCSQAQFEEKHQVEGNAVNECPAQSAVGVATVTVDEPMHLGLDTIVTPIFNIEPLQGEPVRFGLDPAGLLPEFLETSVRSGGDYGVTLSANDISAEAELLSLGLTFWGVPGDSRHDAERGWECLGGFGACTPPVGASTPPFLSLPTACRVPLHSSLTGDSWQQEFEQQSGRLYPLASAEMGALDGCNRLSLAPEIEAGPEQREGSMPSGFGLKVQLGSEVGEESAEGMAVSSVRDMSVALPAGVVLNTAVANELGTCSESEIGFSRVQALDPLSEPGVLTPTFAPTLPEPLQQGVNFCPNTSKLGTVKISTPLLPGLLEGAVYLAAPQNFREGPPENPLGSFLAVYVVASEPATGVLLELPGRLVVDPVTGQVTATFENMPQLPLQEVELSFIGGERAALSTPARCGTYTTRASFTPWSAAPGEAPRTASSTFKIASGPHGGACPGASLPFAPSLTAGTTTLNAGAFNPLTVTVGREDGEQAIESGRLKLPPGLSAVLTGVPLCPEAQANAGTCGGESQVGETTVSAGLGGAPYTIAGRVYLTGPYENAPFGLAIVARSRAGPFVLREGSPIVVRAKLEIDPSTAALTIATGPIPSMVEGFALQIKHLNITMNRPGFMLNPTSCEPMSITGSIGGDEGAQAPVFSSFQVANCTELKFDPKLTASTRANGEPVGHGASMRIGIGTAAGQTNIHSLKVDLPKQLPTRLSTLERACRRAVFTANPANCPGSSVVGTAKVSTPVLGVAMTGPAYFVSNGRESLPDLDIDLEGDGVRLNLRGITFVSRADVTSVTFRSLPDIPLKSFELTLPEGTHSALGTEMQLCKQKLQMPAAVTGQNGAVVHTSVRVAVTGCPRTRPAVRRKGRNAKGAKARVSR
jgi:hypothetical protein